MAGAVSKRQITIEQKLRLIVITTSLCAVLLVCGFFVLTGIRWHESKLRGELKSTSRLVSTWSAAPLDFQLGWEDATNAVSVLAEYPNITEGLLYCLSDDDAFQAETGFEIAPERPPQLPSLEPARSLAEPIRHSWDNALVQRCRVVRQRLRVQRY